jgi:hypothetical protein
MEKCTNFSFSSKEVDVSFPAAMSDFKLNEKENFVREIWAITPGEIINLLNSFDSD